MKKTIIAIVVVVLLALGVYYFLKSSNSVTVVNDQTPVTNTVKVADKATSTASVNKTETVIGKSVDSLNITAYHYGVGDTEILFVSGVHGGYAWNTALLGYKMMDYFKANPTLIPENIKVTVIPVLNPDGLKKVVGTAGVFTADDVPSLDKTIAGRFNADNVDLNRNFDCDWQSKGTWQNKSVSGGTEVFSEPETQAIKNYIEVNKPEAVVAYYSAAGGVYSSNCHNGILPITSSLTNAYAKASGYTANEDFDFYETTGDMTNWLAKIKIPAISVLLTNHSDIEWTKNLAGIKSVLKYFTK
jgi:hypothetical protein